MFHMALRPWIIFLLMFLGGLLDQQFLKFPAYQKGSELEEAIKLSLISHNLFLYSFNSIFTLQTSNNTLVIRSTGAKLARSGSHLLHIDVAMFLDLSWFDIVCMNQDQRELKLFAPSGYKLITVQYVVRCTTCNARGVFWSFKKVVTIKRWFTIKPQVQLINGWGS